MLYETQLQWIRDLQHALRSPFMDGFFIAWNYVDTLYFSLIAISLVWYLWDRRIGIRFFYVMALSLVLVKFLKALFNEPRPSQIDPTVGILSFHSPGFPSGAAQTAAIAFGLVCIECKQHLYRYLALIFAILLCFSRVYLGAHFLTDILGGLIVGGLLILTYWKIFPLFEKSWKLAALALPFVLLLMSFYPSITLSSMSYLFFALLGVYVGLISKPIPTEKKFSKRALPAFTVIAGLCVLFFAIEILPHLEILWYFGEGYWLSFLGAWFVQKRKSFS